MRLGSRAFDILVLLVEHAGEVVVGVARWLRSADVALIGRKRVGAWRGQAEIVGDDRVRRRARIAGYAGLLACLCGSNGQRGAPRAR